MDAEGSGACVCWRMSSTLGSVTHPHTFAVAAVVAPFPAGTLLNTADAAQIGITPNTTFLTNYLKGVESGNKRAIARNAARGAQKVRPFRRAQLLQDVQSCVVG